MNIFKIRGPGLKGLILMLPVFLLVLSHASFAETYTASSDFSSTQGHRNWYYQEYTGYGFQNMTWDGGNNRWYGSYTWCLLWNDGGHPQSYYPVRKWVAPSACTIHVTGNAHDMNGGGGDGVWVGIYDTNLNLLWSAYIANGDSTGYNFDLNVNVQPGDAIYFLIDQLSNCGWDSTCFNPTITTPNTAGYVNSKSRPIQQWITWNNDYYSTGYINGFPDLYNWGLTCKGINFWSPYNGDRELHTLYKNGDHAASSDPGEITAFIANGWVDEGYCHIYATQRENTAPLYRYYNSAIPDYACGTSSPEAGYVQDVLLGYVYPAVDMIYLESPVANFGFDILEGCSGQYIEDKNSGQGNLWTGYWGSSFGNVPHWCPDDHPYDYTPMPGVDYQGHPCPVEWIIFDGDKLEKQWCGYAWNAEMNGGSSTRPVVSTMHVHETIEKVTINGYHAYKVTYEWMWDAIPPNHNNVFGGGEFPLFHYKPDFINRAIAYDGPNPWTWAAPTEVVMQSEGNGWSGNPTEKWSGAFSPNHSTGAAYVDITPGFFHVVMKLSNPQIYHARAYGVIVADINTWYGPYEFYFVVGSLDYCRGFAYTVNGH